MSDEKKPATMNFAQVLHALDDGRVQAGLSEEMEALIEALRDHATSTNGKAKGELAVKLKLSIDGGMVDANVEYTVKTPKAPHGRTTFWTTTSGGITRENPKQLGLPGVRDVPVGDRPVADAGRATAVV